MTLEEKVIFGGFMQFDENETLARIYVTEDEIPVNISVGNDSDTDLKNGEECTAFFWSDDYEVSVFPSESDYEQLGTHMDTISMIPAGTFPADPGREDFKQNALILFTGIVKEVEGNPAPKEGDPLWRLRIETYGLSFDLYRYEDEPVAPGYIVHGQVWLYGVLKKTVGK